MPQNHNTLTGLFSDIADAIRAKTGGSSQIVADDFPTAIANILSGPARTSADLEASGATVTAPAGVYSSDASKSVASGSATTPATTISSSPTITVSSAGLITASNSKTQSVTPTVSAGYVSSGTAGTITVGGSNTSQLTTQAAQTIYPSTSDQTITSGKYLTGTQTFKGVLLTNLTAGNIKKDVVVKVGDSADDDRIISVTGTYEGSGGGGVDPSQVSGFAINASTSVSQSSTKYGFGYLVGQTWSSWLTSGFNTSNGFVVEYNGGLYCYNGGEYFVIKKYASSTTIQSLNSTIDFALYYLAPAPPMM